MIEKSADFHIAANDAIKHAAACGYLEIVKFLIEKGADFQTENNYAIGWAAENGHLEVVKLLVEKGLVSKQEIIMQLDLQLSKTVKNY